MKNLTKVIGIILMAILCINCVTVTGTIGDKDLKIAELEQQHAIKNVVILAIVFAAGYYYLNQHPELIN